MIRDRKTHSLKPLGIALERFHVLFRKYRTNNAKTKQHKNIYACAKDRVTQATDANVGKGATVRVNIDKEDAGGLKKNPFPTSASVVCVTLSFAHA